jgi:hypothetical protein
MMNINLLRMLSKKAILNLLIYSSLFLPAYADNHLPCEMSHFEKNGDAYDVSSEKDENGNIYVKIGITLSTSIGGRVHTIIVKKRPNGTIYLNHLPSIGDSIEVEYDENGEETSGNGMDTPLFKRWRNKYKDLLRKIDYSNCPPLDSNDFPLIITLNSFKVTPILAEILIEWETGSEVNNAGFHIWRGVKIENGSGDYEATFLRERIKPELIDPESDEDCIIKIRGQLKEANFSRKLKSISAVGNSTESICYSFTDISDLDNGTYYYLLEDISNNGKSTFHCKHIDAVTIGQGPAIDLESAINYCKEVTGSNN